MKKHIAIGALLILGASASAQYGRPLGQSVGRGTTGTPVAPPAQIVKSLGYLADGQSARITAWGGVGLVAAGTATFRLALAIPVPFQGAVVADQRPVTTSSSWSAIMVVTRAGNRLQGFSLSTVTPGVTLSKPVLLDYADNVAISCDAAITGNAFSRAQCYGLLVEMIPQ